jgi:uncharacterized protein (DUF58 family)
VTGHFGPRLRAALLAGRRIGVRGSGAAALRRGDGYEFSELRAYVDGDDPRRIDWAATARAGAMQTRVVLEERALMLAVALDGSASMHVGRTRTNYELAIDAARVWYGAALDDDRCARVGSKPLVLGNVRGRTAAAACSAVRDERAPFEATVRLSAALLPRGSRLLVASDFFELDAILAALRACVARFDVTALVLRDPWHDDLPLAGFVRLRDAETGAVARAYVSRAARARYRAAVALRERHVLDVLRSTGLRVALLDASGGAEAALGRALHIA